jgi:hypothetical protein
LLQGKPDALALGCIELLVDDVDVDRAADRGSRGRFVGVSEFRRIVFRQGRADRRAGWTDSTRPVARSATPEIIRLVKRRATDTAIPTFYGG